MYPILFWEPPALHRFTRCFTEPGRLDDDRHDRRPCGRRFAAGTERLDRRGVQGYLCSILEHAAEVAYLVTHTIHGTIFFWGKCR